MLWDLLTGVDFSFTGVAVEIVVSSPCSHGGPCRLSGCVLCEGSWFNERKDGECPSMRTLIESGGFGFAD